MNNGILIKKITDSKIISAIRSGLVMIIPVLMVGAFGLTLRSFPIPIYQQFITSFCGGVIYNVLSFIYNASFGMLSVYMTITVGYSLGNIYIKNNNSNSISTSFCAVIAFLISVGFGTKDFQITSFSAVGMFTAIICGIGAPLLYMLFCDKVSGKRLYSDGADSSFNKAIGDVFPVAIIGIIFAALNTLIALFTSCGNLWSLTSMLFNRMFAGVSESFVGAFLYVFLSSILWFFGVHGSDVLESVNIGLFEPAVLKNAEDFAAGKAPTLIYTKTFFDVFVLIGGCGTLLSLLIALLIFSKRKNNRVVAKFASLPMLFNINEIMVFGLPIIYNPIMFVPFITVPVVSLIIASLSMSLGLVPLTINEVEWTTPIILGGYQATGSVSGAVLQVIILAVGVLIYMPFVKLYDEEKQRQAEKNLVGLIDVLKGIEESREKVMLTELSGIQGNIAKQLVNDLRNEIAKKKLVMNYQPQYGDTGKLIGAEALLRWNHPSFGFIYPPLIIKLASEAGELINLEKYIFKKVKEDTCSIDTDIIISINATPIFLCSDDFIDTLSTYFPDAKSGKAKICIEITEQSELVNNEKTVEVFQKLKALGFMLAIDDFSMGYTSLKYLSDNKFDTVKLDGSLVRGLDNPRNKDIIASIVYLSSSLGFSVLAEFVENEHQRQMLAQIGCVKYQGYLFSKPLSKDDFMQLMENNKIITMYSLHK